MTDETIQVKILTDGGKTVLKVDDTSKQSLTDALSNPDGVVVQGDVCPDDPGVPYAESICAAMSGDAKESTDDGKTETGIDKHA